MAYNGYLAPHAEKIKELSAQGYSPVVIADALYDHGVRASNGGNNAFQQKESLAQMVKYVLRDEPTRKKAMADRVALAKERREKIKQGKIAGLSYTEIAKETGMNAAYISQLWNEKLVKEVERENLPALITLSELRSRF